MAKYVKAFSVVLLLLFSVSVFAHTAHEDNSIASENPTLFGSSDNSYSEYAQADASSFGYLPYYGILDMEWGIDASQPRSKRQLTFSGQIGLLFMPVPFLALGPQVVVKTIDISPWDLENSLIATLSKGNEPCIGVGVQSPLYVQLPANFGNFVTLMLYGGVTLGYMFDFSKIDVGKLLETEEKHVALKYSRAESGPYCSVDAGIRLSISRLIVGAVYRYPVLWTMHTSKPLLGITVGFTLE